MRNENNQNNDAARQLTASQRFKAAFFTVAGIAVLLVCLIITSQIWRFTSEAAAAPGAVTRLNAGDSHVQVQFTTAAGDTVEYPQN